ARPASIPQRVLHCAPHPRCHGRSTWAFRGEQSMVSFTVTPLTDHTGAEVIGLDFTQPIDIEARATLSRAFAERHVLVMRKQHFPPEQFKVAAQLFGELYTHDKKERHVPGHPDVVELDIGCALRHGCFGQGLRRSCARGEGRACFEKKPTRAHRRCAAIATVRLWSCRCCPLAGSVLDHCRSLIDSSRPRSMSKWDMGGRAARAFNRFVR